MAVSKGIASRAALLPVLPGGPALVDGPSNIHLGSARWRSKAGRWSAHSSRAPASPYCAVLALPPATTSRSTSRLDRSIAVSDVLAAEEAAGAPLGAVLGTLAARPRRRHLAAAELNILHLQRHGRLRLLFLPSRRRPDG